MSIVGEMIKKKRMQLNISQNKLAKSAGIAQATLSAIESSTKSPTVDTVEKLATALYCTVSELMGEEKENGFILTDQQRKILDIFALLNDSGKKFVMDQAEYAIHQEIFRQDAFAQSAI